MTHPIWVIGAGTLGTRLIQHWRSHDPDSTLLAETHTTRRHEHLRSFAQTRLRSDPDPEQSFDAILVAIPPSSAQGAYTDEVQRAIQHCSTHGRVVLISSTGVYPEAFPPRLCTEDTPTANTPRAQRMLAAERLILNDPRGCVIRMAGLYNYDRGPHRVYMRTPESSRHPDGLINLIHYDDAATLAFAVLTHPNPPKITLGCDDAPITRQDLARASVQAPRYASLDTERIECTFTGSGDFVSKRCDNSKTRQTLHWKPQWDDIRDWLATTEGT